MVVVTGATGAIGSYLTKHFNASVYDIRRDNYFPECDVLINCIGVSNSDYFSNADPQELTDTIEANLVSVIYMMQIALMNMRYKGYGRIINMSSMLSNWAVPGTYAYTASKAGLNAAIRVIAKEEAKHNILINNLNLGYMDGGMTHRLNNQEALKARIPVGKFGDMSEIARACQFLMDSNYITGSCIDINGGLW